MTTLKKIFLLSLVLLPVGVSMIYIAVKANQLFQPVFYIGIGLVLFFMIFFGIVVYKQITEGDF